MTDTGLTKWERAVAKLLEQTQDKKLEWIVVEKSQYPIKSTEEGAVLKLQQADKTLILYQQKYTEYINVGKQLLLGSLGGGDIREVETSRATLVLFDEDTNSVLYYFPRTDLIEDLYKAATFNAAGVEDFLNDLLED